MPAVVVGRVDADTPALPVVSGCIITITTSPGFSRGRLR